MKQPFSTFLASRRLICRMTSFQSNDFPRVRYVPGSTLQRCIQEGTRARGVICRCTFLFRPAYMRAVSSFCTITGPSSTRNSALSLSRQHASTCCCRGACRTIPTVSHRSIHNKTPFAMITQNTSLAVFQPHQWRNYRCFRAVLEKFSGPADCVAARGGAGQVNRSAL